jgi:hypothetical protein
MAQHAVLMALRAVLMARHEEQMAPRAALTARHGEQIPGGAVVMAHRRMRPMAAVARVVAVVATTKIVRRCGRSFSR